MCNEWSYIFFQGEKERTFFPWRYNLFFHITAHPAQKYIIYTLSLAVGVGRPQQPKHRNNPVLSSKVPRICKKNGLTNSVQSSLKSNPLFVTLILHIVYRKLPQIRYSSGLAVFPSVFVFRFKSVCWVYNNECSICTCTARSQERILNHFKTLD